MPERVLQKYRFFKDGSASLRKDLLSSAKPLRLRGAQPVFRAGDPVKKVYFVGEGALNVYVSGYSGRNVTLYNVEPGELCPINLGAVLATGEMLASGKGKNGFRAVTVGAADFRGILGRHQHLRRFVIECLAPKFETIVRQISEVTTRSVDSRIERFFAEHLDEIDEQGRLRVTNAQIATEIGASREVVNRKLRAMQNAGLVELGRGSIRLLRPDQMLALKVASKAGK